MKKGKVLGKGQLAVGIMVIALAAAVWLNAKYLPSSSKYLGEAAYVNSEEDKGAVETAAKAEEDYFASAKKEREKVKEEAEERVKELLKSENLTEEEKNDALSSIKKLAETIEKENNVETLLKAKGFEKTLAVISDKGVNIVVKSEGLTSQQTVIIQDIVTNETGISIANLKIIPVVK